MGFTSYQVSSYGRLWSYKQDKILAGYKTEQKYIVATLTNDTGKPKSVRIHTAIGRVFLGITEEDIESGISVDHINRIRWDNRLCNLRRANKSTQSINQNRHTYICGKEIQKLSTEGKVLKTYISIAEAANDLKIHRVIFKTSTGYSEVYTASRIEIKCNIFSCDDYLLIRSF